VEERGGHSASFPVDLPEFFVKAFSEEGDVWMDNFAGSGTTLLAAAENGRIGVGIEVLPEYVAVILERLQNKLEIEPELVR